MLFSKEKERLTATAPVIGLAGQKLEIKEFPNLCNLYFLYLLRPLIGREHPRNSSNALPRNIYLSWNRWTVFIIMWSWMHFLSLVCHSISNLKKSQDGQQLYSSYDLLFGIAFLSAKIWILIIFTSSSNSVQSLFLELRINFFIFFIFFADSGYLSWV